MPGLMTFAGVAWPVITLLTSAPVAVGLLARKRAATPATCGAAIDVNINTTGVTHPPRDETKTTLKRPWSGIF